MIRGSNCGACKIFIWLINFMKGVVNYVNTHGYFLMSSLKKCKLDQGQRRLSLGNSGLLITDCETENTDAQKQDCYTQQLRRGVVESWRTFAELDWRNKYPWIQAKEDGIYCIYCSHDRATTRNKSGKFVSVPFTAIRSNKT